MGRDNRSKTATSERMKTTLEPGAFEEPLNLPPGEQFITKGMLLRNRKKIVNFAVIALLTASLLAFFVKPKAPNAQLVTPSQELQGYEAGLPGNNNLAQKVASSYSIAFVLMGSPYTAKNAEALEHVRSWAQNRFQASPDFLHPVSIKQEDEPNDTIIGAFGYNLFASVRYAMESVVGGILQTRIADFHDEAAYKSFADSFFELYGEDGEAATLLARYQSDRAKGAIDILLWTAAWGASLLSSIAAITLSSRSKRFETIRLSLVLAWGLIAVSYGTTAWMTNSIPACISGALATFAACYFAKPFVLLTRQDSSLKVYFVTLSSRWIALSVWATYSLAAITMLTWIRSATPENNDPITLLLSSFSGNFLTDPEDGKRIVARVIGIMWVLISLWSFSQKDKDAKIADQLEAELRSL